jgi:hypothetical protein
MTSWSALELLYEVAIMKQLGIDAKRAAIITCGLGTKARVGILLSLLALHGEKYAATIKAINRLTTNSKRNIIVHGHLAIDNETGAMMFTSRRADQSFSASQVTFMPNDLFQHAIKINDETKIIQADLGISEVDLHDFAMIGINAANKRRTSPKPPKSKDS